MDISYSDMFQLSQAFPRTPRMPVLFLGHGSPMNAIEDNTFTKGFRSAATAIPKPHAILCVSAHWLTRGTAFTAMEHPPTIHDFGGFPEELYQVNYPAPGSPELAQAAGALLLPSASEMDLKWGLDHGAWSVIKHMYPDADVPVIQMSIDLSRDAQWHYDLGEKLMPLRDRGILIIGSGNIIHNLRLVDFSNLSNEGYGYDWAQEAHHTFHSLLMGKNVNPLIAYQRLGSAAQLSVPTPDHYLPLLYVLGASKKEEKLSLFNDQLVGGSISMTSVLIQ